MAPLFHYSADGSMPARAKIFMMSPLLPPANNRSVSADRTKERKKNSANKIVDRESNELQGSFGGKPESIAVSPRGRCSRQDDCHSARDAERNCWWANLQHGVSCIARWMAIGKMQFPSRKA